MSRASRGASGEKKVSALIKKLKAPHYLFDDLTLINAASGMSHQLDHVLIHPHGLFVIETKNYFGKIEVDGASGYWYKTIRGQRIKISDPLRQNKAHAIALRKALKSKYKPIPVVVFVRDNAPYLPDENVINLQDLALFIDSYPFEREYGQKELDEMKSLIASVGADISHKEHVENIRIIKAAKKEQEAEMTYAIERGLCPCCDARIEVHGYEYRCPKCGYSFKL